MIVDRLVITDHFLRRWMERVEGINTLEVMSVFYGRPSKRYTDADFVKMLRQQSFPLAAKKSQISETIGPAPRSGKMRFGDLLIQTTDGKAVTIKPR